MSGTERTLELNTNATLAAGLALVAVAALAGGGLIATVDSAQVGFFLSGGNPAGVAIGGALGSGLMTPAGVVVGSLVGGEVAGPSGATAGLQIGGIVGAALGGAGGAL